MDFQALIVIALICLFALVVLYFAERWWRPRKLRRLWKKIEREQKAGTYKQPRLYPECLFTVTFDEAEISCTSPSGEIQKLKWDDLKRVEIVTNDHGPFLPDIFWVLQGLTKECVIPHGATGERELSDCLGKLPEFSFEAVAEAMCSTSNRRFLCWGIAKPNHGNLEGA